MSNNPSRGQHLGFSRRFDPLTSHARKRCEVQRRRRRLTGGLALHGYAVTAEEAQRCLRLSAGERGPARRRTLP